MSEAALWHLLTRPPGPAGIARARYGAAMALHARNLISCQALEAFREAAAFDEQDPAQVLADRGLSLPEIPPPSPELGLALLLDEADRLLAGLTGPGLAEIRKGLAACAGQTPHPLQGKPNALVKRLLPEATALLSATHPGLAEAITLAAPSLDWLTYDAYGAAIGPHFPRAHAFASLIGEVAPYAAKDFDFGLFLIAPGILYRDHAHAAPELYLPLTGPHLWRFAPDTPFHARPAFAPVWNPPHQPHATLTGAQPFLALFGWTREVNEPAYTLAALDWPEHEASK